MIKRFAFAAGLLLASTTSLQAQAPAPALDVRLGAQTTAPTGSLDNGYDYGFGLYARAGAPFGPVKLMGALTWTRFKAENNIFDDLDLITVQFGPHLLLAQGVELGLEGAYISEFEKLGFSPSISIGIPNFEAVLSYTTTLSGTQASWLALGVGLKF